MDPLVALGDHRAHAEQPRPLRAPVARRPGPVVLPGQHDGRHPRPGRRAAASKTVISSSSGRSRVQFPSRPGTSPLQRARSANAARIITSWLPRRVA